ncbi:ER zinc exporter, ZIP family Zip3 [Schizosaccharomyces pombe]|uniref:Uncharacterized zinc transporter P8A3.03 n=1 Tax=Schizosaccharomyces pombe (strain 972 / ATCC 24843) TaxID=284812 RepID=YLW3_SCHPO|nr:putative ZIP zinc transporter 1 [Schizosaccharomyces pombe]Q9UT11.1 RecName: Full=Uncharacterized zinc transporter P8A3.03; Flags: Precursor [Schizosaccharomyces pombe 972h-]CAB55170.1 ZIP zinc transporter 1 (predicted) [Schizosaccharomyces pombe]|eukprot:NP_594942.1 putative ZIP zinc transporter 1 [Schizosaccharomyces pombe]
MFLLQRFFIYGLFLACFYTTVFGEKHFEAEEYRDSFLSQENMNKINHTTIERLFREMTENDPSLLSSSKTLAELSKGELAKAREDLKSVLSFLKNNLPVDTESSSEAFTIEKDNNSCVWLNSVKSFVEKQFSYSSGTNGILATFLTAIPPNIFILLVPKSFDTSMLNLFVAVSAGSLLGDVFLQLLPTVYSTNGGDFPASSVYSILIGALVFFLMDKGIRILIHERPSSLSKPKKDGEETSSVNKPSASSTQTDVKGVEGLRKRNVKDDQNSKGHEPDLIRHVVEEVSEEYNDKTVVYLNLLCDSFHNFMDGLAITSAFFTNTSIGISTTFAVLLHEIPAEIGDLAILLRNGYTKSQVLVLQMITMVTGLLGAIVATYIYTASSSSSPYGSFLLQLEDKLLPFTAGGFLYIAYLGVFPELLEINLSKGKLGNMIYTALYMMFIVGGFSFLYYV